LDIHVTILEPIKKGRPYAYPYYFKPLSRDVKWNGNSSFEQESQTLLLIFCLTWLERITFHVIRCWGAGMMIERLVVLTWIIDTRGWRVVKGRRVTVLQGKKPMSRRLRLWCCRTAVVRGVVRRVVSAVPAALQGVPAPHRSPLLAPTPRETCLQHNLNNFIPYHILTWILPSIN